MEDPGYLPGPVGEACGQSHIPVAGHPAGGHRLEGVYDAEGRFGHPIPLFPETVPKLQFWNSFLRFIGKTGVLAGFSRSLVQNQPVLEQAPLSFYLKFADYYRENGELFIFY
jgi:hypothetical protein